MRYKGSEGGEWKKGLRVKVMEEARKRGEEELGKIRRKNCNMLNRGFQKDGERIVTRLRVGARVGW